ncbi:Endoplasmic reticulum membrane protein 65 [Cyphellophora attinorum]|uniref:Endoplasmic reticulum membrane protein 65 n=1 Tax=Cyphellophora attinorum TaxID=1664694 RepID=A0A0N1HP48_9EURO|nr:Endoplasmic reticulum membrane protein 65 [Phialophora attinorum]KPI39443.1 Endoplasmic reticulum membrane protein 65 [Phialophora attinorum]
MTTTGSMPLTPVSEYSERRAPDHGAAVGNEHDANKGESPNHYNRPEGQGQQHLSPVLADENDVILTEKSLASNIDKNGISPLSQYTQREATATESAAEAQRNVDLASLREQGAKRFPLSALPSPTDTNLSQPSSPRPLAHFGLRRLSTDTHIRSARRDASGTGSQQQSPTSSGIPVSTTASHEDRRRVKNLVIDTSGHGLQESKNRPSHLQRAQSTPAPPRTSTSMRRASDKDRTTTNIAHIDIPKDDWNKLRQSQDRSNPLPSPMPTSIPRPPLSIPTYLQLELSSQRPSDALIHRSASSDFPYESSRAKIERLQNFISLPIHLEAVLWFGMLACLDSWLYTFTILPLRLLKSFYILAESWTTNFYQEVRWVVGFVFSGSFRLWRRRKQDSKTVKASKGEPSTRAANGAASTHPHPQRARHHRRTKSVPSNLMPDDKADMLKGLLILFTCLVLLRFDASRMYHWIRGQNAVKLYVIYNVLEVCDRLFSALGQDVLECLFSREALERKPDGHSKVLRPLWLFGMALCYTIVHSTALFYQVITLNVAVNAYSNSLITLLLSNQFVEIKSTVFKKFEKENLFQLTCADVVERFQLWHMLVIIAARNIAETTNMIFPSSAASFFPSKTNLASALAANMSATPPMPPPRMVTPILPLSFTIVPDMITSVTSYVPHISHVLGPFVIVLGSEMFVDWLKHAYINKFNNTRPAIYDRFLDVLAKDYYTNAFGDQNLTKRLGLPVIPLSCLLIRTGVQITKMFMSSWATSSASNNASPSLASIQEAYASSRGPVAVSTPAAIVYKIDELLGGYPSAIANSSVTSYVNTALIAIIIFLVALAIKLILGMILLAFARNRYRSMKEREKEPIYHVEGGRRVGGWGVVEVDEDKRRSIYDDDPDGLRALQEREARDKAKRESHRGAGVAVDSFDRVRRYEMVAKRIW